MESLEDRSLLAGSPLITELMADNQSGLYNEFLQDHPDWIEIYNPGPGALDLTGWYLTDQKDELHLWQFPPGVVLGDDEYLVVFASGLDPGTQVPEGELHTNFRLGRGGEYLGLVRPDGTTVVAEYEPNYPPQRANVSYGLTAELDDTTFFSTPTPGHVNPPAFRASVFSQKAGFHDSPFLVQLDRAALSSPIHYTTDGSVPTAASPRYSDAGLWIAQTTTLRVKGLGPNSDGVVHTRSYLFLDDIVAQPAAPGGWPTVWTAADGHTAIADYGFDPEIAQDARYVGELSEDLWALPTLSLAIAPADLMAPTTGIYSNPLASGGTWERPVSLELIDPIEGQLLQVNAGLRLSGGTSRDPANTPKHSFRVYFKNEYGPTVLDAPLFADPGEQRFDRLELKAGLQDSWLQPDAALRQSAVLLRDQWVRETLLEMGQPAARGRFVHLYLNGLYWGIYNLSESIDEGFAGIRFGGSKSDYDVIDSGQLEAGTDEAWRSLMQLAASGLQSNADYQQIQRHLDVNNFIDFLLVRMFAGDREWSGGNWYAVRNRTRAEPFRFLSWDSENVLHEVDAGVLPTDPAAVNPVVQLFGALARNELFRRSFADRVQRHLLAGGALTPDRNAARWNQHVASLAAAVVAESARWGDYRRDVQPVGEGPHALYTRDDHWRVEADRLTRDYFPQRTDRVLEQLRAAGLFPAVAAPVFSTPGGTLTPGFALSMTAAQGAIYYTRDGSDPARDDGQIRPEATRYENPIPLATDTLIKARSLVGDQWSALVEGTFVRPPTLQISEILYHAAFREDPNSPYTSDDFDFLELVNVGSESVDLAGAAFTQGIAFTFPAADHPRLDPGQRLVLVRNQQAFASRYDTTLIRIDGEFSGRLNNSGERIVLTGTLGQTLADVTYDDQWFEITDAEGFSLVRRQETVSSADLSRISQWRPSHYVGGSPGKADPGYNPDSIVISEALTHSDEPESDWLELHNTTTADIDLSGWYLSSMNDRRQYRIPAGTVLPAGGYLVFCKEKPVFVVGHAGNMGFTISKLGEKISLTSPGKGEELGGYRLDVDFTYGFNSTAFVRHVNSAGDVQYLPALENTPGFPNSGPSVDRIWDRRQLSLEAVISEIMYYPAGHGDEYIELYNPHPETVYLDRPFPPSWRFTEGVYFSFPESASMPARSYALVVPIEPAVFRAKYAVPPETQVFGPYAGELINTGERLELSRAVEASAFVPYSSTDEVFYNHPSANWPAEAAGGGASLVRVSHRAAANDAANWRAGPDGGTPGRPNLDATSPTRVVERLAFYNNSFYDGNDPAAGAADDAAIAVDKLPLLPGHAARFENYTSYQSGLNGIMVDLHRPPGTPGLADFEFRMGNDSYPDGWSRAPAPTSVSVRRGAGVGGSDRVTLIWQDGAIFNQWLQVTVQATPNTGLATEDVFYFGNAAAETGDSPNSARVDGTDHGRTRDFHQNRMVPGITNYFDFDRDGSVGMADLAIAYRHAAGCTRELRLIDLSAQNAPQIDAAFSQRRTSPGLDLMAEHVVLIPNQADQVVAIAASGQTQVTGMNLRVEIDAESPQSGVPRLTRVDYAGGIWDTVGHISWQCAPAESIASLQSSVAAIASQVTVNPQGPVAHLIVDTTGVTAGRFTVRLSQAGVDSDFLGAPAYLRHGSITMASPGDANLDGRFTSQDIVQVFRQGEYEDTVAGNSTWIDGDWNQDGEYSSNDLVLAFQQGTYEIEAARQERPLPSAADLAAAVAWPAAPRAKSSLQSHRPPRGNLGDTEEARRMGNATDRS